MAFDGVQGLALIWGEGGDIDQADDMSCVGSSVCDGRTAVGVNDGEHRPGICRITLVT